MKRKTKATVAIHELKIAEGTERPPLGEAIRRCGIPASLQAVVLDDDAGVFRPLGAVGPDDVVVLDWGRDRGYYYAGRLLDALSSRSGPAAGNWRRADISGAAVLPGLPVETLVLDRHLRDLDRALADGEDCASARAELIAAFAGHRAAFAARLAAYVAEAEAEAEAGPTRCQVCGRELDRDEADLGCLCASCDLAREMSEAGDNY